MPPLAVALLDDHVLRGILAAQALLAILLAGQWLGDVWHSRGWPARCIFAGALGVLVYVLAGQAKAYLLGIPFDAFSVLGVIAYTLLLTGLVWHTVREHRTRRGR
ncbi:hypothetical protein [Microcystis phage MinS1]|nr:hypothetical protein [Microcystis phage MinS1]